MGQEETKEENEKKIESRSTLEVELPIISQGNSYALHCPNLGIEINITKQTLFPFSISKIRNKALYGMFSLNAYDTLFGGSWLLDHGVNYKERFLQKSRGSINLCFFLLPPRKYNLREGREKSLFISVMPLTPIGSEPLLLQIFETNGQSFPLKLD